VPAAKKAWSEREAIADGVVIARDLVNEPANILYPVEFARRASTLRKAGVAVDILDEKALQKLGMRALLGVGQGSEQSPRFLKLTYSPRGAQGKSLALVGKGVVFDSGGLSLKTAGGMETMKTDMSGAAAVIGAMSALQALGVKTRVSGYVPMVENMPSGTAIRPGDVLKIRNGKTVEVLNTDAEGRLVLADALAWMSEQHPQAMIDFATLTGAMVIALGKKVAGFFATSPELAEQVRAAASHTGEQVWQMPMLEDMRKQIDSDVADVKNIGTRWGGAIFAALFLKDFVGDVPWIHVDIAGPARSDEAEHYLPKGATGMGTRLLIDWIEQRAATG